MIVRKLIAPISVGDIHVGKKKDRAPATLRSIAHALALFVAVVWAFPTYGQYQPNDLQDSSPQKFEANSNLVVVPVGVYDQGLVRRGGTPSEWKCENEDRKRIHNLPPSEPFLPANCNPAQIHHLQLEDFRILQDGSPQNIVSFSEQVAPFMYVRDDYGFHVDWSNNPRGIWSTDDLDNIIGFNDPAYAYAFAYVPPDPKTAHTCHRLMITVDQKNAIVLAPREYCDGQSPSDPLNGTKLGGWMERMLFVKRRGGIPLWTQSGVFFDTLGQSRVEVAIDFHWYDLHREWVFGEFRATVGVRGIVLNPDNNVVYRFSDFGLYGPEIPNWAPPDDDGTFDNSYFDKYQLPTRCALQFDLPTWKYVLKLMLADGKDFGLVEIPIQVGNFDPQELRLSSIFLCKRFRNAHVSEVERKAANVAPQYVPLVSVDTEFMPAGDTRVHKDESVITYFQICDPVIARDPSAHLSARVRVVEAESGRVSAEVPVDNIDTVERAGPGIIPIAQQISLKGLHKGSYRIEVQAKDSSGRTSIVDSAEFSIT